MRVMLDATSALGETGVGLYGRNLVNTMLSSESDLELTLVFMGNVSQAPAEWRKKARVIGTDRPLMRAWVCGVGAFLRLAWPSGWPSDFDVYHSLELFLPQIAEGRSVLTVHDVDRGSTLAKEMLADRAIRHATHVIAVSSYTRERVVQRGLKDRDAVSVVYHGLPPIPIPEDPGGLLKRFNVPRPYILYVGGLYQKAKNLTGLASAYSRLRKEHRLPHTLVIAGAIETHYEDALRAIVNSAKGEPVLHLGFVLEDVKAALYAKAGVFVSPSFIEGFGFTILEAMAAGCPVITSNRCSCPEVVGDAGMTVDPEDEGMMMSAIAKVLGDEELRSAMVKRGRERVRMFSWAACARATVDVYRSVSKKHTSEH